MKKKGRIFFRIYVIVYFIFLIEAGGAYFSETENIELSLLLPLIIPWCFVNRDRILKKWNGETYADAMMRIFVSACISIVLKRQVEAFIGNSMIAALIILPLIIIAYFAKLRKDLNFLNRKPYIRFLIIFMAEVFFTIFFNISISISISPESWAYILSPAELLKILIVLAVFLPLLLFLNGVRKDQTLKPIRREAGSLCFGIFVLLYMIVFIFVFFQIVSLMINL